MATTTHLEPSRIQRISLFLAGACYSFPRQLVAMMGPRCLSTRLKAECVSARACVDAVCLCQPDEGQRSVYFQQPRFVEGKYPICSSILLSPTLILSLFQQQQPAKKKLISLLRTRASASALPPAHFLLNFHLLNVS